MRFSFFVAILMFCFSNLALAQSPLHEFETVNLELTKHANVMPLRAYNRKGLMVDNLNKKFGLINLSQPLPSKRTTLVNAKLDARGYAHDSVKDQRNNHLAYILRKKLLHDGQERYLRKKEGELENVEISGYQVKKLHGDGEIKQAFELGVNLLIINTFHRFMNYTG